ncbi:sulfite exporter TauE/SafE family protein [Moritella sp. 36]|uniref:sulfite exporter TauE/SafE family protein n=1 Tax=Moritella sp. 36 TaxID=2746233 RepID=UPI001BACC775|nr:sulfite exporter TauE/SafE family protein [Moritella sp. 36]QUM88838.1 sulfite exporter TauE/SafE family protein [Moritella sp. 36]
MASCNLLKFSESVGYGCKPPPNMLVKMLKTTSKNNASDDHKLQFLIADRPEQFYIIGKVNSGSAAVPLIGIFVGAKIGAMISLKLNEVVLRKCINVFVFLSSIKIISMAF